MSASNPEIKDRSYGIIPIRLTPSSATSTSPPTPTNTQILLIHQKIVDPTNPYFWTFPKGHAEEGDENERGSAVRELWEETGLRVEMEDFVSLK
jgi:8-oxo-dGTP pyrophosphatase MutT (NUDIX family)